jgi:hypothetical protein
MRSMIVIVCALVLGGCMQETVRFQAKPQQQALVRDGIPALVSQKRGSVVMIRPAARQFAAGGRPVFVVGLHNLARTPIDFAVADVRVTQAVGSAAVPLKVLAYEDLVQEERTRQVVVAMLVGAAAGLNAAAAANAGYSHTTSTVYGAGGIRTTHTVSYSSARAAAAQARAMRQNERMIDGVLAEGQANLARLEREVLKDNTLMPGEWYGGTLHLEPPTQSEAAAGPKSYTIALKVGADDHEIAVIQHGAR